MYLYWLYIYFVSAETAENTIFVTTGPPSSSRLQDRWRGWWRSTRPKCRLSDFSLMAIREDRSVICGAVCESCLLWSDKLLKCWWKLMTPWTSVPANVYDPPGVRPCRFRLFGTVPVESSAFQKARRTGEYGSHRARSPLWDERVRPSPTDARN